MIIKLNIKSWTLKFEIRLKSSAQHADFAVCKHKLRRDHHLKNFIYEHKIKELQLRQRHDN